MSARNNLPKQSPNMVSEIHQEQETAPQRRLSRHSWSVHLMQMLYIRNLERDLTECDHTVETSPSSVEADDFLYDANKESEPSLVSFIDDPAQDETNPFVSPLTTRQVSSDPSPADPLKSLESPRKSSFRSPRPAGPCRSTSLSISSTHSIEVRLPCQRELLTRTRLMSFRDNIVEVQPIQPMKELVEDPDQLWYQEDELKNIKRRANKLVTNIKSQRPTRKGLKYCSRGLERFISPEETIINRTQGWDAVLNEQNAQRRKSVYAEDCIAGVYRFSSFASQRAANARAIRDEKEAKKYLLLA